MRNCCNNKQIRFQYDKNGNSLFYKNIKIDDWDYGGNGNLTQDLDRKNLQIEFNLLNLPSRIIFADGSEIVIFYAVNAGKVSTASGCIKSTQIKQICTDYKMLIICANLFYLRIENL